MPEPLTIAKLEREAFANLDDPGPLGVYADALGQVGDPRGEYLVIASELHAARVTTARALVESSLTGEAFVRTASLLRRAHQLLALHGPAWDAVAEAAGVAHKFIRVPRASIKGCSSS